MTEGPFYSNHLDVNETDSEIVIDFYLKELKEQNLICKMVLSHETAQKLSNKLKMVVPSDKTISKEKLKVLVVEDNETYRKELINYLANNGFDIFSANNGEQAIKQTNKLKPDVILMDHIMPVLNGLDAARVIKQNPEHENTRVYLMIGYGKVTDFSEIVGNVVHKILQKPLALSDLKLEILTD